MRKTALSAVISGLLFLFLPIVSVAQDEEVARFTELEGLIEDGLFERALERAQLFLKDFPASTNRELVLYRLGTVQLRLERFDEAAATLETYLAEFPAGLNLIEARLLLATAYDGAWRHNDALGLLTTLLGTRGISDEFKVACLEKRTGIYTRVGRLEQAREDMQQLVDMRATPQRRYKLANLLYETGELRRSERVFREAIDSGELSDQQRRTSFVRLGIALYQRGRHQEVVELLQPLTALYGDDPVMAGTLAWSLFRLQRYKEAYDIFSALPEDRDLAFARAVRSGRELLLVHEYSAAIATFSRLVDEYGSNKQYAEAFRGLADGYRAVGDRLNAARTLEKLVDALTDERSRFLLLLEIGRLHADTIGSGGEAVSAFRRALALRPNDERSDEVLLELIRAQVVQGDVVGAGDSIVLFLKDYEESDHTEEVLYLAGSIYERAGDYERALEHYRKIAQHRGRSPYRDDAYAAGLRIVERLRRWEEVFNVGSEFINEFPAHEDAADVHLTVANALYRLGRHDEGIEHVRQAMDMRGQETPGADAVQLLAWGLYKKGDLIGAQEEYLKIVDSYTDSEYVEEAYYWLGWIAQVNNNYTDANRYFSRLVSRFPDSSYAEISLFQRANNLLRNDDRAAAVNVLQELLERFPEGVYAEQARVLLVDNHIELGNFKLALEAMPLFIEGDPVLQSSASQLLEKGEALARNGKFEAAEAAFAEVLEKHPDSPLADDALFNRANVLYRTERYSDAIGTLASLEEKYPESDRADAADFLAGQCLMKLRRFDEAITRFNGVLDERGSDPRAQSTLNYLIGVCHEQLGREEEAAAAYRVYLANLSDPAEQLPRRMEIAILFIDNGLHDEAVAQLRGIITASRNDSMEMNAQYLIGRALELKGDLEAAAEEYLKVTYAHSSSPAGALMSRMQAGRLYEQLKRWEEAKNVYGAIARNHPNTQFGKLAAVRIEAIDRILSGEAPDPAAAVLDDPPPNPQK